MMCMTGARHVRRRVCVLVMAIATIGASLLMPGVAAADTYRWKNPASGNWDVPGNWVHTSGTGTVGFPFGPGDQADFPPFTQVPYTVTIPANRTIVLGAITVGLVSVTIRGDNPIILSGGSLQNAWLVTVGGHLTLDVPLLLQSDLQVLTEEGKVICGKPITQTSNGARTLTKIGRGLMDLMATASHSGGTRVHDGYLMLKNLLGPALISGPLEIGDGIGDEISASVIAILPGQLNGVAAVQVSSDGRLGIQAPNRIGDLQIRNGLLTLHNGFQGFDPKLTMSTLDMSGGLVLVSQSRPGGSELVLEGDVIATSSGVVPARIVSTAVDAPLNMLTATRTFTVHDGPAAIDLLLDISVAGTGDAGLIKDGRGTLAFARDLVDSELHTNSYPGATVVRQGTLELARRAGTVAVPGNLQIGVGLGPAIVSIPGVEQNSENIARLSFVSVGPGGLLRANHDQARLRGLTIGSGGRVVLGEGARAAWETDSLTIAGGGRLTIAGGDNKSSLRLLGNLTAGGPQGPAVIDGGGLITLRNASHELLVSGGPQAIHLQVDATITGPGSIASQLLKKGDGVALFGAGSSLACDIQVLKGGVLVNGTQTSGSVTLGNATLGGNGRVRNVGSSSGGTLSPGVNLGRFSTDSLWLSGNTRFAVELHGAMQGALPTIIQHDQLAVTGTVSLGNAKLVPTVAANALFGAPVTIIENDGVDPITGTFAGLPEGSTLAVGEAVFTISYQGGDGNDVVLTDTSVPQPELEPVPTRITSSLAAPATPTVAKPAMPAKPAMRWIFAEGAQGRFDTYVSIANGNAEAAIATLTFLREDEPPVVQTVEIEPFARKTIYAGDVPDVADRTFGLVVEATQPVIAERAMYYANAQEQLWSGGHVTTGVVAPATRWSLTEGRVGGPHAFTTYILIANPSTTAAEVTITYLPESGEPIVKTYTAPAASRYNVDVRTVVPELRNASFGARIEVTNNIPIAVERSSYWNVNGVSLAGGSNALATSLP